MEATNNHIIHSQSHESSGFFREVLKNVADPDAALIGLMLMGPKDSNSKGLGSRFYRGNTLLTHKIDDFCATSDGFGLDAYWRVYPVAKAPEHGRGLASDSSAIIVIGIDIDHQASYKAASGYAPSLEWVLQFLANFSHPPTIVVSTGGGVHAYWRLQRPFLIVDDATRAEAEMLCYGLQRAVRDAMGGYTMDATHDLARILRIPGTVNHKCGERVKLLYADGPDYNASALPKSSPPAAKIKRHAADYTPAPVTLHTLADVAQAFPLSAAVFDGSRHFPSPSERDESAAYYLVKAGWAYSDIVDTLVRLRGAPKTNSRGEIRHDYYQRTIGKAQDTVSRETVFTQPHTATTPPLQSSVAAVAPSKASESSPEADTGEPDTYYRRTDAGNAEFIRDMNGSEILFDHTTQRWLLWSTHSYQPDSVSLIRNIAMNAMRERARRATLVLDEDEQKAEATWSGMSENTNRISNALRELASMPSVAVTCDELDRNPDLVGLPNGVFSVAEMRFRPGEYSDRVTQAARPAYDPAATCPKWCEFVRSVCENRDYEEYDGAMKARFVQMAAGYSLTGHTREQVWIILLGAGANGKTTLLNVLQHVIGSYAYPLEFRAIQKLPIVSQSGPTPEIAYLRGKRFVPVNETPEDAVIDEQRIKSMTGGSELVARDLHKSSITFKPVLKLWAGFNSMPISRDPSRGFWRRVRVVPFRREFPVGKDMLEELISEAPGILNWLLEGARMWMAEGLPHVPEIAEAVRDEAERNDPLIAFMNEVCVRGAHAKIRTSRLFDLWKDWSHANDKTLLATKAEFSGAMQRRFRTQKSNGNMYYLGIDEKAPESTTPF